MAKTGRGNGRPRYNVRTSELCDFVSYATAERKKKISLFHCQNGELGLGLLCVLFANND